MTARRVDQRGITLVEVLLSLVISAMIIGPLGAWAVLAVAQPPVVTDENLQVASRSLLGIHLSNDLSAASAAAVGANNDEVDFEDCIDGPGSDPGEVLLVLLIADVEPQRIVYKEAALRDGGPPDGERRSIWRRVCPLNDPYDTTAIEVLTDVVPGASSASCPSVGATAICRHVEFVAVPEPGEPVSIRGTRRVDAASLRFDRTGNRLPVAKISVTNISGDGPFQVTLSPAGSRDDDGEIVEYRWTIPEGPFVEGDADRTFEERVDPDDPDGVAAGAEQVVVWDEPGTYFVQLMVTDNDDATATTYKRVEIERVGVTANLQVTPERGEAELTEFEFEPVGSAGPPDSTLVYEWIVRTPLPDLFDDEGQLLDPAPQPEPNTQYTVVRTDPAPFRSSLPSSMLGSVQVTLNVYDLDAVMAAHDNVNGLEDLALVDEFDEAMRDTVTYPITVDEPSPTFAAPQLPAADPDSPVAVASFQPVDGTEVALDASGSTPGGTGAELVGFEWDFGPVSGAVSGPDPVFPLVLPNGGTFRYLLTVTDQDGRTGATNASFDVDAPLGPAPALEVVDGWLEWPEVPGASAYRVEFQFTECGAAAQTTSAAGYRTGVMSLPVPPSFCAAAGPTQARVVVERRSGDVVVEERASDWVSVAPMLLAYVGGP